MSSLFGALPSKRHRARVPVVSTHVCACPWMYACCVISTDYFLPAIRQLAYECLPATSTEPSPFAPLCEYQILSVYIQESRASQMLCYLHFGPSLSIHEKRCRARQVGHSSKLRLNCTQPSKGFEMLHCLPRLFLRAPRSRTCSLCFLGHATRLGKSRELRSCIHQG